MFGLLKKYRKENEYNEKIKPYLIAYDKLEDKDSILNLNFCIEPLDFAVNITLSEEDLRTVKGVYLKRIKDEILKLETELEEKYK